MRVRGCRRPGPGYDSIVTWGIGHAPPLHVLLRLKTWHVMLLQVGGSQAPLSEARALRAKVADISELDG